MDEKKIKCFTDLNAWKEAHKLVLLVYRISKKFPKEEQYGLTNQIRRAVISITSNLAEGFSRNSYKDKVHFYYISIGSLTETQNQTITARDLCYIDITDFNLLWNQSITVSKLCNGLVKSSKNYFV